VRIAGAGAVTAPVKVTDPCPVHAAWTDQRELRVSLQAENKAGTNFRSGFACYYQPILGGPNLKSFFKSLAWSPAIIFHEASTLGMPPENSRFTSSQRLGFNVRKRSIQKSPR
jgi:hypothetical protein